MLQQSRQAADGEQFNPNFRTSHAHLPRGLEISHLPVNVDESSNSGNRDGQPASALQWS